MGLRLLLRLSVVIIIIIIIETEGKGVPPRVKVSTTKTAPVWFAPVSAISFKDVNDFQCFERR